MSTIATPPKYALRDISGNILPQGTSRHRLEWSPTYDTALPSWIVVTNGSGTVKTFANGGPGLQCSLGANSGHVNISLGGLLPVNDKLAAVSIRAVGVTSLGSANNNQIYLRLSSSDNSKGVLLASSNINPTISTTLGLTSIVTQGIGSSSMQLAHKFSTAYPQSPQFHKFIASDIGLLYNFEQELVWAFDGDDVIGYRDLAGLVPRNGTVVLDPRITTVARDDYPIMISKIIVDYWQ